ncbi:hypothetical protein NW762_007878 [Fusarium torreyae]|uniref:Uncharacterized protein n=1 Tax=Fusarium torreyae TaxID=1237075 RepID=A0A9W8VG17_9HYPO|nr:hypothetical protein NW762_007878 [Fusarium torreyae]
MKISFCGFGDATRQWRGRALKLCRRSARMSYRGQPVLELGSSAEESDLVNQLSAEPAPKLLSLLGKALQYPRVLAGMLDAEVGAT